MLTSWEWPAGLTCRSTKRGSAERGVPPFPYPKNAQLVGERSSGQQTHCSTRHQTRHSLPRSHRVFATECEAHVCCFFDPSRARSLHDARCITLAPSFTNQTIGSTKQSRLRNGWDRKSHAQPVDLMAVSCVSDSTASDRVNLPCAHAALTWHCKREQLAATVGSTNARIANDTTPKPMLAAPDITQVQRTQAP